MQQKTQEEIQQDLEPLLMELLDVFDDAELSVKNIMKELCCYTGDGYMKSHAMRASIKEQLVGAGYYLPDIPNTGLEVIHEGYRIKILRSTHEHDVPRAQSITRAAYMCTGGQDMLSPDEMDPEEFWKSADVQKPMPNGDQILQDKLRQQDDGLIHLLIDWEVLSDDEVIVSLSRPRAPWRHDEKPDLFWRSRVSNNDRGLEYIPTDENEPFDIFDEEPEDNDNEEGASLG